MNPLGGPRKLQTRCRHRGCPALTRNGYCDAHQHEREQRPRRIEPARAVEGLERILILRGGRLRGGRFGRDRMHVVRWCAGLKKQALRHPEIAAWIVERHETVVADEPMNPVPGNPAAIRLLGEQGVKLRWARAAGQADRRAFRLIRDPRDQTLRRGLRQRRRVLHLDHDAAAALHAYTGVRQLRPSRASSAALPSGPSLPA